MSSGTTRRGVILATGSALGLGAVGSAAAECHGETGAGQGAEMDLDAGGETPRDELARLEVEIMAAYADVQPPSGFTQAERDQALETGHSMREGVVVFDGRSEIEGIQGHGTGWLVEDGYVVTNAHNVNHPVGGRTVDILCHLVDGTVLDAEVVDFVRGDHQQPDVAVLSTDYDGPGLPLGSTDSLSEGQPLVQVGHPGGFGFWTITLGAFQEIDGDDVVSTVPALEGASGSPVTTLDGEVVGMLYAQAAEEPTDGGPPSVTDAPVQQGLLVQEGVSQHVSVETIVGKLEDWT